MRLYDYQYEGVDFLRRRQRAYLADEMGLGKTVQTLVAASMVFPRSMLIVCPASAVPNWEAELSQWYGKLSQWDGPEGCGADLDGETEISVVSYSYLSRHRRRFWREYDLVILDEAHYTKSPGARRTRAALTIAQRAKRAWLLSGTPMPNHPGELWTVFRYLFPGVPRALKITSAFQWLDRFTQWVPTEYGPRPYAAKNIESLRPYLRRIMLRRKLADVALDLPPLRVHISRLPAGDSKLDQKLRELIEAETGQPEDQVYLATLRRYLGKHKAPLIAEIVRDEVQSQQYDKIVVLYYHREVGAVFEHCFKLHGIPYAGFDGATPSSKRQEEIDVFNARPGARVFLAQQSAAGIAINLQVASEVILVEPAWSPEDNAQAIKRIHRIGQTSPCRARIFAVEKTLDEQIMSALAQKTRMIAETIGG